MSRNCHLRMMCWRQTWLLLRYAWKGKCSWTSMPNGYRWNKTTFWFVFLIHILEMYCWARILDVIYCVFQRVSLPSLSLKIKYGTKSTCCLPIQLSMWAMTTCMCSNCIWIYWRPSFRHLHPDIRKKYYIPSSRLVCLNSWKISIWTNRLKMISAGKKSWSRILWNWLLHRR